MTLEEIKRLIESIGLPFTYYSFPEKEAPALPYVLFYFPNSGNFGADDRVYQKISALNIELYTKEKSFLLEDQVEAILDNANLYWEKSESFLSSENMYEVLYQTEVIINGE